MKSPERGNGGLDDVLKKVLSDDLPPEAEVRMRKRLAAFGKTLEESEAPRGAKIRTCGERVLPARPALAFRKQALAYSSAAVIILGGIMHLGGQRNALAESLSMLNALFSVGAEIRAAESMDCQAILSPENGVSLTYSIQWSSPKTTGVEVKQAETIVKTLAISEEGITLADPLRNSRVKVEDLGQVKDPQIQAVMDLLSPDALAEKLNTRWQVQGREPRGEREEIFHFADREQGTLVDISVDLNSHLPVTMRTSRPGSGSGRSELRPVLSIRFLWSRRVGR